jgi:hypothetical protein
MMPPRTSELSVNVFALAKYLAPFVLVPFGGWVWRAESALTVLHLKVASLEEQVSNYRQTEHTMIELNTRLQEIQRRLDLSDGEDEP